VEAALAFCRFAHFAATMTLFGATAFVSALAPPELASALAPALRRIAAIAIPLAAVSALAWLAAEAVSMAGALDADALSGVLFDTSFGSVWQGRLILALALVVSLALGRGGPSLVLTLASALLVASLGLVGHATMQAGALGALHRANHALHLLTAAAWFGGLPLFALSLRACRDPALRSAAVTAMRRFSFWGHFDVALIVITGLVNFGLTSGFGSLTATTPYRALLAVKVTLVATMIAIALFNRYVLTPRLKTRPKAIELLRTTCLVEVALGAAVIALVSLFGLLDPM
jgi:putative copper resistance protein D